MQSLWEPLFTLQHWSGPLKTCLPACQTGCHQSKYMFFIIVFNVWWSTFYFLERMHHHNFHNVWNSSQVLVSYRRLVFWSRSVQLCLYSAGCVRPVRYIQRQSALQPSVLSAIWGHFGDMWDNAVTPDSLWTWDSMKPIEPTRRIPTRSRWVGLDLFTIGRFRGFWIGTVGNL